MKKTFLLKLFLCGILTAPLMAGTYRVNNMMADNVSAKVYSTIQKAHDAAANGDTILIEGSPVTYEGFIVNKHLVIKGPGYFLDENPGISANKLAAQISDQIIFGTGSANSLLMGIVSPNTYVGIEVNNITVSRCNLIYLSVSQSVQNITISECYFPGGTYDALGTMVITNLIVSNCIIRGSVSVQPGSTGTFLNNIFTTAYISIPTGFVMKNNIIFTTEESTIYLPSLDAAVSYNMSIADHFGTANNNKANISESALFVGAATESTDEMWQLKAGSPAIGAGEDGVDCGAFGGPGPYILSGLPAGPTIYELNVSSYATPAGKLPMTIKVKSY